MEHERRRTRDQAVEHRRAEHGERGVAQGSHRGRARRTIEQTEFADNLTATQLRQCNRYAVTAAARDEQPAGDDEVAGIGRIALLEQQLPRREMPPDDLIEYILDQLRLGVADQLGNHRGHLAAVDAGPRLGGDDVGCFWIVGQPLLEVAARDDGDVGRLQRSQGRHSAPTRDHGHLTDDVTRANDADDQLAVFGPVDRLQPAGEHDEHLIGLVALLDEDIAGHE